MTTFTHTLDLPSGPLTVIVTGEWHLPPIAETPVFGILRVTDINDRPVQVMPDEMDAIIRAAHTYHRPPVKGHMPPATYKPLPAFPRGGKDTQFFVQ